ncbi:MAG: DeoR family transcriptional regulator [Pseudomonadota bacterium]
MAGATPHSTIRVAARLANGFVLDIVKLIGFGRDVIDGLLITAISQANVAQITRSPELQLTYATLDNPPPDDLRRPVSISAVANSLHIPFETARRRIGALADLGIILTTPKGVIMPTAPLNSPLYRMGAEGHYSIVRRLYFRMRALGVLDDLPGPVHPVAFEPENPPIRLVLRLSSDYLLRLAEPMNANMGDVLTGMVLSDLIQANTEQLGDDQGGSAGGDWDAAGFVDDALRRPARTAEMAQRLGVPAETVRRHLQRLEKSGLCERIENGYVVTARILARPAFVQFMMDNQSHLHRFFGALAEFGVISQWDREESALRGAA